MFFVKSEKSSSFQTTEENVMDQSSWINVPLYSKYLKSTLCRYIMWISLVKLLLSLRMFCAHHTAHAAVYSVTLFNATCIHRVIVCLVTCRLHFRQNDWNLLYMYTYMCYYGNIHYRIQNPLFILLWKVTFTVSTHT